MEIIKKNNNCQNEISDEISKNFASAETNKREVVKSGFSWDDREQLFYGIYKIVNENKEEVVKYSTGELQSLVIDSACRVMAQMHTGKFIGIGQEDIGKVIAANLVFHEYILPNANTGGNFFTKMRQANIYSNVYGTMPVFIDYIVGDSDKGEYTGPDLTLIHPRRFYPQPGKYSIKDMDWCFVDIFVSKEWLQIKQKNNPEVWKIADINEIGSSTVDQINLTNEEKKNTQLKKSIILRAYFTRSGDWLIYEASSKKIVVDEKDYWPGIPLCEKMTIPVLDRYWCLSPYERGGTIQKSIDALQFNYHRAVDKSIDPTTVIDPEEMVMSSVNSDNKFWFAKNKNTNLPRVLATSPEGLATFPTAYNIQKANLMSLSASTDTSVATGIDVGFGKTPQALKMQGEREGARDSWDRHMQEKLIEDVANMMMAVASKRGMDEELKIQNIEKAIDKIKSVYPDEDLEVFRNGIIPSDKLQDLKIRYIVDQGSTNRRNDTGEKLMNFLVSISKNQEILKDINSSGKKINWGEAIKRVAIDQGIQDWDKIVIDAENPSSVDGIGDQGGTVRQEVSLDLPQMNLP